MKKFSILSLVVALSFASMAVAQDEQASPSDAVAPVAAAPAAEAVQQPMAVDSVIMPSEAQSAMAPMAATPMVSGGCCGVQQPMMSQPVMNSQPCCGQAAPAVSNCCQTRTFRVRRPMFRRVRLRGNCCN